MLNQLWQEIINLKQDTCFIRNLSITTTIAIAVTLGLGEAFNHPARLDQQQRIDEFSNVVSAGMIVRTYQSTRH
jgi:hypothetical protein